MKPLADYTEAELLGAGDEELVALLEHEFDIRDWPFSGNGMHEVLETMKGKWEINIEWPRDDKYRVWFGDFVADHASLPRAVAVAALLAVKGGKYAG